jgi:hypothetical protein
MRRIPRPRRQVSTGVLRAARLVGFRYDPGRDAYVLRGVGNRFGPVLRSGPPVDSQAEAIEWSEEMDQLADDRRTRRFRRKPPTETPSRHDVLRR